MTVRFGLDRRLLALGVGGVVILATLSTLTWAAAAGQLGAGRATTMGAGGRLVAASTCTTPALPGTVVAAVTADMGGRMWRGGHWTTPTGRAGSGGGSMMGSSPSGSMRGGTAGWPTRMMTVSLDRASVPAGTVSLRVRNAGVMVHEVVVLPLAAGQAAGQRTVRADGTVAEAGKVAEAASSCEEGGGDGIAPGAASWVTMTLRPGDYELLCNLPGHYTAGMYVTLHVT